MKFQCPQGHIVESTWSKLRNRRICPTCIANLKAPIQQMPSKAKKEGVYRVLALDQSSHKTGYSIFDGKELIGHGVFETTKINPFERLFELQTWLNSMIANWKPDMAGIEEVQYNPNINSSSDQVHAHDIFKLLAQVMGVVIITTMQAKCTIKTVLIQTWRHHCGVRGSKRIDQKRSAQMLVKQWYGLEVTDDESDAICIGKYFAENHKEQPPIGDDSWL